MLRPSASTLGSGYWAPKPNAPPAAESGEEVGVAGAAFAAGAGSADAARAGGGAETCAGAGGPAAGAGSPTGAGGGGEGAATTDAGAGAMLAGGSSRRAALAAALAAVGGARAFRGLAAGVALSADGFAAFAFFPCASAGARTGGDTPAASGGADGRVSTHWSSASGFARPDELRGFSAGAGDDKALTHFGFDGVFAVFAAAGAAAFEMLCACALPAFRACPALAGGAFARLGAEASAEESGVVAFARDLSVVPRMLGMKRLSRPREKTRSRFRHNRSLPRRDATTTFGRNAIRSRRRERIRSRGQRGW